MSHLDVNEVDIAHRGHSSPEVREQPKRGTPQARDAKTVY